MKPFRLDTVLNYRKRLEDIAANRLFDAKRQQEIVQLKLSENSTNLSDLIKKTAQLQRDAVPILDLINYEERILFVKKNIAAIKKSLREKNENVKKARNNLIARSKDRQIMASLKEQQNLAWKDYLNKKENAMLDEIAIIRHDTGQ